MNNLEHLSLIIVKPFRTVETALEYMESISAHEDIRKDIPEMVMTPLIITVENYETLLEDGSLTRYLQFYNENYR